MRLLVTSIFLTVVAFGAKANAAPAPAPAPAPAFAQSANAPGLAARSRCTREDAEIVGTLDDRLRRKYPGFNRALEGNAEMQRYIGGELIGYTAPWLKRIGLALLCRAVAQGELLAVNLIADAYIQGGFGQDRVPEGVRWFEIGAALGISESYFNLGTVYSVGRGVTLDKETALRWFEKAHAAGDKDAALEINIIRFPAGTAPRPSTAPALAPAPATAPPRGQPHSTPYVPPVAPYYGSHPAPTPAPAPATALGPGLAPSATPPAPSVQTEMYRSLIFCAAAGVQLEPMFGKGIEEDAKLLIPRFYDLAAKISISDQQVEREVREITKKNKDRWNAGPSEQAKFLEEVVAKCYDTNLFSRRRK